MRRTIIVGLAALGLAATAHAQKLSFAPQIGLYIPTQQLYQLTTTQTMSDFKLEAGPSFGARLGLAFGSRLGIEVSGSYVPTTFKVSAAGGDPVKQDAKLFLGSGQAVLYLLPRTGLLSLYLSGGVGVVSHGGVAFTGQAKSTDVGGVFGAGAGINLGGLSLTAGADLLAYNPNYQTVQAGGEAKKQKDINVKFGFGIPFGR